MNPLCQTRVTLNSLLRLTNLYSGSDGTWKCWFLRSGENRRTRRKTSLSKDEKQQQTQPTYNAESVNRTRTTFVGGERSHHCAIPSTLVWLHILLFTFICHKISSVAACCQIRGIFKQGVINNQLHRTEMLCMNKEPKILTDSMIRSTNCSVKPNKSWRKMQKEVAKSTK